jgi:RHS repeat-associated protein
MVDGIGTTKYTYSAGNQLLTEDGPFANDTVTNTYLNRLRTGLSLQQPTGVWTNGFAFDAARRLTNVISPAGSFVYQFVPSGVAHHPSRVTLPNTSYITNTFDGNARLTATYLKNNLDTVLDSYSYVYDPANERTNLTRTDATVAYKYDPIGQLTVADSSVNTEDRGYTYDPAWNLNWRTNNGSAGSFTVDNKNEISGACNFTFNYDFNGNMISNGCAYSALTYDKENQLTMVSGDIYKTFRSAFAYDGLNRLRRRIDYQWYVPPPVPPGVLPPAGGGSWVATNTVLYIYDGFRVIQERDTNSVPAVSYTRGTDLGGSLEAAGGIGGLLARSSGYSSGNFTTHNFYFADGNGNITYMLNSSQSMVASYRYDPFGNTISSNGTLASANVYRFSSKEIHANSGMYYYGFRFYDPNLQRWINRDPIGEFPGINLYGYVKSDPLDLVDPFGLDAAAALARLGRFAGYAGEEELIGGGPEDPLADIVAGATLAAGAGLALWDLFHATTYNGHPTDKYGNKLGPSGKPMRHSPQCPTRSSAKDAAQDAGGGKPPVEHSNPKDGTKPHFHPGDADGEKVPGSPHYTYPR